MPARILLVDDHVMFRQSIKANLEQQSDWIVCGEAGNGLEAVEKTLSLRPDLVLMDLSMPNMNGIEATKRILQAAPETRVVILTMHNSEEIETQAKKAGAVGCVTKSRSLDDLHKTMVEALASRSGPGDAR